MLLAISAVVAGLLLLIWSADRFVDGAAAAARWQGIPPFVVGMVIIGFGTSAPEIVVSVIASWQGNPGVALGNAIGSNIANLLLVIGVTASIQAMHFQSAILRWEFPLLLVASFLTAGLLWDRQLDHWDGALLLTAFAFIMGLTLRRAFKKSAVSPSKTNSELPELTQKAAWLWLTLGLALLLLSSRLLVWGCVTVAQTLGVSDLVIGLTVVAIGTSLPELASSIAAVKKGESDLAFGNIIGSNLFNTLVVIGLAGVIQPMNIAQDVQYRDLPIMLFATICVYLLCFWNIRTKIIQRRQGLLLTFFWGVYTLVLTGTTVRNLGSF